MSSNEVTNRTSNQMTVNTDLSKIFIFGNIYRNISFENTTGAEQVLAAGTLIGAIGATGVGEIMESAASDGSQLPVGVLAQDVTLAIGETRTVSICISGHVAEEKLVFDGTDDLDTDVSDRTYRDRIAADTAGIILRESEELTNFDN